MKMVVECFAKSLSKLASITKQVFAFGVEAFLNFLGTSKNFLGTSFGFIGTSFCYRNARIFHKTVVFDYLLNVAFNLSVLTLKLSFVVSHNRYRGVGKPICV